MFLQEFNSTTLLRDTGKVYKAAYKKPIMITRQNDEAVIMMSKKKYADLMKKANA